MTRVLPTAFAQERGWGVGGEFLDFERYAALSANWKSSGDILSQVKDALERTLEGVPIQCICAAGSLGRMEASEHSDGDLIIVLEERVGLKSVEATETMAKVWGALEPIGIARPNPEGVFAEPTNLQQLMENIGHAKEELAVSGKRMLLLLETQPVYGQGAYIDLIDALVDRYARDYVAEDSRKEWTFLLNDLIRYFRDICVHYQCTFDNESERGRDQWTIRNVKLRHSRLIMYAGLLVLLGECSKIRHDKVDWLKARLKWTPLERLAAVYEANGDCSFSRIAGLYDVFLGRLSDKDVRQGLAVAYEARNNHPAFAQLKANSDGLVAELLRFVIARRGDWSERFFEYLLF